MTTGDSAVLARSPLHPIVLAAGLGSRLGKATNGRHKCLVAVGGQPILARALDTFVASGIRDVTVVVGHLGDQVVEFARQWSNRLRFEFAWNDRYADTGTSQSLASGLAAVGPGHDILIVEADVAFDRRALVRLLTADAPDATLVASFEPPMSGSAVVCDPASRVVDWLHVSDQGSDFRYEGAFKTVNLTRLHAATVTALDRALSAVLAMRRDAPLEYAMRSLVRDHHADIVAVDVRDAPWFEVDTPADLRIARQVFRQTMTEGGI